MAACPRKAPGPFPGFAAVLLFCTTFSACFTDAGAPLPLGAGRAGAVALLRDERSAVAPGLARALEGAGYGVTLLDWERAASGCLPREGVDLLVLADARHLPLGARDLVVDTLAGGGRVLAIGAPALSDLRARVGTDWLDASAWARESARRLPSAPIRVAPGGWHRNAQSAAPPSTISPDPSQGEGCWRISTDLIGWENYSAQVPGAFSADSQLLCFEARGDASTPQVLVECTEGDGSRWMATVAIGTDWRAFQLAPASFVFFRNGSPPARGRSGDSLRFAKVARISIGWAGSLTPAVRSGPHTCWVRGLATATGAGTPPSFSVPDIVSLCPSYAVYPMDEVASLKSDPDQCVVARNVALGWKHAAFSPPWRERGRGFRRGRAWRWIPILNAFDASGRKRGALISLIIGDRVFPGATWASVAVADPAQALQPGLLESVGPPPGR